MFYIVQTVFTKRIIMLSSRGDIGIRFKRNKRLKQR